MLTPEELAEAKSMSMEGNDDDLHPEERRNRSTISNRMTLLEGDVVSVSGITMQILGPGRGVDSFLTAWKEESVINIGTFFVDQIDT